MKKMEFCNEWIALIMSCVSSVSYSVLINCKPGDQFFSSRRLRQGDPLFLDLFILYAEGLSSLLNYFDYSGSTKGVTVAKGGSNINHLLFADDCVLFGRAKLDECNNLQATLHMYERASG